MKYYVTFAIDGTITAETEADSDEEMKKLISDNVNLFPSNVDLGDLENCEADLIQVNNEKGETVYEY